MSRRVTFFILAASAALIATPAAADPECFGQPCHLPEAVEPPPAAVLMPETADATAPEAYAAAPRPAPVKALPHVTATQEEPPQPMARRPLPSIKPVAESANARLEPVRLAPRIKSRQGCAVAASGCVFPRSQRRAPASYVRTRAHRRRIRPTWWATTASPGDCRCGPRRALRRGQRPIYLIAPSAKIISIDSDD